MIFSDGNLTSMLSLTGSTFQSTGCVPMHVLATTIEKGEFEMVLAEIHLDWVYFFLSFAHNFFIERRTTSDDFHS